MARYRLRFLLQEFDLPRGTTIIGRSADCHVTIEDPLVSRQHARIVIDGEDAVFEDMGSRNGVKVNGAAARSATRLKDGDRLRIGTQELVFCRVGPAANSPAKTTGFLRYCAQCRLPYPQELAACPACGATEQTDEETLSGQFGATSKHSWSVQLLVEVMDKALSVGRIADAVRMVQRAKNQVEERIGGGGQIEPDQIATLCISTCKVSLAAEDPAWAGWVAHLYKQMAAVPPIPVTEALAETAQKFPTELRTSIAEIVAAVRGSSAPSANPEALARLEQLHLLLENARDTAAPEHKPTDVDPG